MEEKRSEREREKFILPGNNARCEIPLRIRDYPVVLRKPSNFAQARIREKAVENLPAFKESS